MVKRSKKVYVITFLLLVSSTVSAATTVNTNFNMSMNLFAMITIIKVKDLNFPDQTITGSAITATVATTDSGAATFNVTGTNSRSITKSVVQSSIIMSASGVTGTITVDTFVLAGPTAFDSSGNATGIKVGATAHVLATNTNGDYSGTGTLRVVYQ